MDILKTLKKEIDAELSALFLGKTPEILYEPMAYPVHSGGKRLRPILCLLACQAVSGRYEQAMHTALALELLHTFTLVHDDLMDNDDARRGRPAVHKKWDDATAILAGDGLVAMAYQTLLKTGNSGLPKVLRLFTDGLLILCEGQAMDKAFEQRENVPMPEYQEMIEKKTAKLLEVACESGAVLGNADVNTQEALRAFAMNLGIAFQIQDDLLDITGDENIIGKPIFSDIRENKKTFLTLHVFNHAAPELRKQFQYFMGRSTLSPENISTIFSIMEKSGAVNKALESCLGYLNSAAAELEILPQSQAKTVLFELIERLKHRIN